MFPQLWEATLRCHWVMKPGHAAPSMPKVSVAISIKIYNKTNNKNIFDPKLEKNKNKCPSQS